VIVNYCEKCTSNTAVVSLWQEELMLIFYNLLKLKINKSESRLFSSNVEMRYV